MKYPKPIMSISEMCKLGISKDFLKKAVHSQSASNFAKKTSESRNAKWMIDTEEFEKWRVNSKHEPEKNEIKEYAKLVVNKRRKRA